MKNARFALCALLLSALSAPALAEDRIIESHSDAAMGQDATDFAVATRAQAALSSKRATASIPERATHKSPSRATRPWAEREQKQIASARKSAKA